MRIRYYVINVFKCKDSSAVQHHISTKCKKSKKCILCQEGRVWSETFSIATKIIQLNVFNVKNVPGML